MKLEVAKNAVTSKVARQILKTQKHSPKLLFVGGVIGVAGTVVLACNATLKLDQIANEAEKEHANATTRREHSKATIKAVTKIGQIYAPAAGLGVVSVAALTGSHVILTRRNTALMAAYAALDKGFNEYRERVREELGIDKEYQLRHGVSTETVEIHDTENGKVHKLKSKSIPQGVSIYARFFDECSKSWNRTPSYNQMFIRSQQNYANDLLRARGHVFLNEVYDMLGLERSQEGAVVGWVLGNGDDFIDFGVFDGDIYMGQEFVNGNEQSILLDFNVDGVIWDKI